jgi:hypothetical protein
MKAAWALDLGATPAFLLAGWIDGWLPQGSNMLKGLASW